MEVCGSEQFDYEYRRKIFDNNGYNVIFLHLYKEKYKWNHQFKKNCTHYFELLFNNAPK